MHITVEVDCSKEECAQWAEWDQWTDQRFVQGLVDRDKFKLIFSNFFTEWYFKTYQSRLKSCFRPPAVFLLSAELDNNLTSIISLF